MRYIAHVLRIDFKFELDKVQKEILQIGRAIKRPALTAMHTKGGISFIVVTRESADGLLDRLRPELDNIGAVANYWCHMAPIDLAARHGGIDPFLSRVKEAWQSVGQRNEAEYVRQPKRREM